MLSELNSYQWPSEEKKETLKSFVWVKYGFIYECSNELSNVFFAATTCDPVKCYRKMQIV